MNMGMINRILVFFVIICSAISNAAQTEKKAYHADITRTEYGIPHIYGKNYGDIGFGFGYVFAEDNYCVFVESILSVRSHRSRFIGASKSNIESDRYYKLLEIQNKARKSWPKQSANTHELLSGYAAGLNRFRNSMTGKKHCAISEYVGDITAIDILAYQLALAMSTSAEKLMKQLVNVQTPDSSLAEDSQRGIPKTLAWADFKSSDLGSNAWAIGNAEGKYRNSFLLANPHFPWDGTKRFYMAHLVIPGELDVMGASLFGVPVIQIGFNRNVSWSHTVSASSQFILYALQLHPEDPFRYKYGDNYIRMEKRNISIDVKQSDGSIKKEKKTYYHTKHGPIVSDPARSIDWSRQQAYALSDVNRDNVWMTEQWLQINRAYSLEAIRSSIEETQGVPWVNTIAMQNNGEVLYLDSSRVPKMSNTGLSKCWAAPHAEAIFHQTGVAILNGANQLCDIIKDGSVDISPLNMAPMLKGSDHVANSNNSHWASHVDQRLEGYSLLYGPEKAPLSLRARLGLLMLNDLLQEREKINLDKLQEVLLDNRSYSAQLLMPDLLSICNEIKDDKEISRACKILSAWDGKANRKSVGVHLFREIVMSLKKQGKVGYFSDKFDYKDALNTPRKLTKDKNIVLGSIKNVIAFFKEKHIPLNVPLWKVQFVQRKEKKIPIHGGLGQVGVFNTIDGPIVEKEGYRVAYGSSFIMLVAMNKGAPTAKGILTYSQSTNNLSPHSVDQTELYAQKKLFYFPYTKSQIDSKAIARYSVVSGLW